MIVHRWHSQHIYHLEFAMMVHLFHLDTTIGEKNMMR